MASKPSVESHWFQPKPALTEEVCGPLVCTDLMISQLGLSACREATSHLPVRATALLNGQRLVGGWAVGLHLPQMLKKRASVEQCVLRAGGLPAYGSGELSFKASILRVSRTPVRRSVENAELPTLPWEVLGDVEREVLEDAAISVLQTSLDVQEAKQDQPRLGLGWETSREVQGRQNRLCSIFAFKTSSGLQLNST